jgi:hypothetical protein
VSKYFSSLLMEVLLKAKQLWKRLNRKLDENSEGSRPILEVRAQCGVPMVSRPISGYY